MRKDDIDTPALLLDIDLMEANIAAMAAYFRDRPMERRLRESDGRTLEALEGYHGGQTQGSS